MLMLILILLLMMLLLLLLILLMLLLLVVKLQVLFVLLNVRKSCRRWPTRRLWPTELTGVFSIRWRWYQIQCELILDAIERGSGLRRMRCVYMLLMMLIVGGKCVMVGEIVRQVVVIVGSWMILNVLR